MALTPEERAEIARRNGAKSKGPVTQAGKSISRANGFKHGGRAELLLRDMARAVAGDIGGPAALRRALRAAVRKRKPAGYPEWKAVVSMAADEWRIERWNALEETIRVPDSRRAPAPGAGQAAGEGLPAAAWSMAERAAILGLLNQERKRLVQSREQARKTYGELRSRSRAMKKRKAAAGLPKILRLTRESME